VPDLAQLRPVVPTTHAPRFLLLYGSLRERSFSRLLTEEAARLLTAMVAEVKIFNPSGLPLPDDAVNQLRMLTFPNQSSVAKAFLEFDEAGRMKPSAYFDRVVDVMEELVKFTLLPRDIGPYLVDRYSERKESAEELSKRVNQKAIYGDGPFPVILAATPLRSPHASLVFPTQRTFAPAYPGGHPVLSYPRFHDRDAVGPDPDARFRHRRARIRPAGGVVQFHCGDLRFARGDVY
jgi:hypothetical protein